MSFGLEIAEYWASIFIHSFLHGKTAMQADELADEIVYKFIKSPSWKYQQRKRYERNR